MKATAAGMIAGLVLVTTVVTAINWSSSDSDSPIAGVLDGPPGGPPELHCIISESELRIDVGQRGTVGVDTGPIGANAVIGDPTIAVIDGHTGAAENQTYFITGLKAGSTTFSLKRGDETCASIPVMVEDPDPPPPPPLLPPTAMAETTTPVIAVGKVAFLDGAQSHDNDENDTSIVEYIWQFDNQTTPVDDSFTVKTPLAVHFLTLNTAGEYLVTLTVKDDEGQESTPTASDAHVLIKVVEVTFTPNPVNILTGGSAKVTATVVPPSAVGEVTFRIETPARAQVDPTALAATPGVLTISQATASTKLLAEISAQGGGADVVGTETINVVQDFTVHITSIKNHKGVAIGDPTGGLCVDKIAKYEASVEPDLSTSEMSVQWLLSDAGRNSFSPFGGPAQALTLTHTQNRTGEFDVKVKVTIGTVPKDSVETRRVIVIGLGVSAKDANNNALASGSVIRVNDTITYISSLAPANATTDLQWQFAPHGTPEDPPTGWQNFTSGNMHPSHPATETAAGNFDVRIRAKIGNDTCFSDPYNIIVAQALVASVTAGGTALGSPAEVCVGEEVTYTGAYAPSTLAVVSKEWQVSFHGQDNWVPFSSGQGWPSQKTFENTPGDYDVRVVVVASGANGQAEIPSDPYRIIVYRVDITANDGATDPATRLTNPASPAIPEWGSAWISGDPFIPTAQGARKTGDVILTAGFNPSSPAPTTFTWTGPGTTQATDPFKRVISRGTPAENLVNANLGSHVCKSAIVWVVGTVWDNGAFLNSGGCRSNLLGFLATSAADGDTGPFEKDGGNGQASAGIFFPAKPGTEFGDSPTDSQMAVTSVKVAKGEPGKIWRSEFKASHNYWEVSSESSISRGRRIIESKKAQTGDPFTSDNEEVEFTINAGTRPFVNGDKWNFVVMDGAPGWGSAMELQATIVPHAASGHQDISFDIRRARVAQIWDNDILKLTRLCPVSRSGGAFELSPV